MYIPKEKAARISFYKKKSAQTSSRRKLLDTYIVPTAEQVYAKYDQRLDLVKIKTRFVTQTAESEDCTRERQVPISYHLDQKIIKNNKLSTKIGQDITLLPSKNGLCLFYALAEICYESRLPNDTSAEDAYAQAFATSVPQDPQEPSIRGHVKNQSYTICKALNICFMDLEKFLNLISQYKSEHMKYKSISHEGSVFPMFPCVLHYRGHILLATHSQQAKRFLFSYEALLDAFTLPFPEDIDFLQMEHTVVNSQVVKGKKTTNKFFRPSKNKKKAQLQPVLNSQKMEDNAAPRAAPSSSISFRIRKQLKKINQLSLPNEDDSDKDVALFVLKAKLGFLQSEDIPVASSMMAVIFLSSLQKSRHKTLFAKKDTQVIQTYSLQKKLYDTVEVPIPSRPNGEVSLKRCLKPLKLRSSLDPVVHPTPFKEFQTKEIRNRKTYYENKNHAESYQLWQLEKPFPKTKFPELAQADTAQKHQIPWKNYPKVPYKRIEKWIKKEQQQNNQSKSDQLIQGQLLQTSTRKSTPRSEYQLSLINKFKLQEVLAGQSQSIENFEPKLIDKLALSYLTEGKITNLHCMVDPPAHRQVLRPTNQPIVNTAFHLRNGKLSPGSITVNPMGTISPAFKDIWVKAGFTLTDDQCKNAPQTSGGHPHLRLGCNYMQAAARKELVAKVLKRTEQGLYTTIVCIGDKYAKSKSFFDYAFRYLISNSPNIIPLPLEDAGDDEKLAYEEQQTEIKILQREIFLEIDAKKLGTRNATYAATMESEGLLTASDVTTLSHFDRITHVAVRPDVATYDRNYHFSNEASFESDTWKPGNITHRLYKTTIQAFEKSQFFQNQRQLGAIFYECFDVHYYLRDWTPYRPRDIDHIYTTGTNFFPLPGVYVLPFREGKYTICKGKIHMQARCDQTGYHHNMVEFPEPKGKSIHYGWTTVFWDHRSTDQWFVRPLPKLNCPVLGSVQTAFLELALETLKGTKTPVTALSGFPPPWDAEDTKSFTRSLCLDWTENLKISCQLKSQKIKKETGCFCCPNEYNHQDTFADWYNQNVVDPRNFNETLQDDYSIGKSGLLKLQMEQPFTQELKTSGNLKDAQDDDQFQYVMQKQAYLSHLLYRVSERPDKVLIVSGNLLQRRINVSYVNKFDPRSQYDIKKLQEDVPWSLLAADIQVDKFASNEEFTQVILAGENPQPQQRESTVQKNKFLESPKNKILELAQADTVLKSNFSGKVDLTQPKIQIPNVIEIQPVLKRSIDTLDKAAHLQSNPKDIASIYAQSVRTVVQRIKINMPTREDTLKNGAIEQIEYYQHKQINDLQLTQVNPLSVGSHGHDILQGQLDAILQTYRRYPNPTLIKNNRMIDASAFFQRQISHQIRFIHN